MKYKFSVHVLAFQELVFTALQGAQLSSELGSYKSLLFQSEEGLLKATSFSSEAYVSTSLQVPGLQPNLKAAASVRQLYEVIKTLKGDNCVVEFSDGSLRLKAGDVSVKLQLQMDVDVIDEPEVFKKAAEYRKINDVKGLASKLKRLIVFSDVTDEGYCSVVRFTPVHYVSASKVSLSVDTNNEIELLEHESFNIPALSVARLIKLLQTSQDVEYFVDKNCILFRISNKTRVSLQFSTISYPPYESVVKKSQSYRMSFTIDKDKLIENLNVVKLFATKEEPGVTLTWGSDNVLTIGKESSLGQGKTSMSYKGSGEDKNSSVNITLLLSAVHGFTKKEINVKISDNKREPIVLKEENYEVYIMQRLG